MPAPIDWPDRLVPPPRAVIGTPHLAGHLHDGNDVLDRPRDDDAQRLDLVDAGVGAVELARSDVEADLAGDVLAQVAGEEGTLLFGERGHVGHTERMKDEG